MVSVKEIEGAFGDNDELSALVATAMDADILIILTNVEGVYQDDENGIRKLLKVIDEIDDDFIAGMSGKSSMGRGGIQSKLRAARIASEAGIPVVIASGKENICINSLIEGKAGTYIKPRRSLNEKKRWLRYASVPVGDVFIDENAKKALVEGSASLLPVGIRDISGSFEKGDVIRIVDEAGKEVARGIINYSSDELKLIMRKKSWEVRDILGTAYREVIYRGNMVIMGDV